MNVIDESNVDESSLIFFKDWVTGFLRKIYGDLLNKCDAVMEKGAEKPLHWKQILYQHKQGIILLELAL